MKEVNPDLYISWKEDILSFDDENFANVIRKLERWYDVQIELDDQEPANNRVALYVDNKSLQDILEVIALMNNLQYQQIIEVNLILPLIRKNKTPFHLLIYYSLGFLSPAFCSP